MPHFHIQPQRFSCILTEPHSLNELRSLIFGDIAYLEAILEDGFGFNLTLLCSLLILINSKTLPKSGNKAYKIRFSY